MGKIKDRNSKDLTEADEIKKMWQENIEELYKNVLMTCINTMVWTLTQSIIQDTYPGVWNQVHHNKNFITKTNGGDGVPPELFQILKHDAIKVLYSICQQIWKTGSGHRSGNGQFSF